MPISIKGCTGYSLADDKKTIYDKDGKAVGGKKENFTITIDGKKHKVQRAKLAWCALNNVNPFELSDDCLFYYIDGEPRKRSIMPYNSQTRADDTDFVKTLKAWAKKQGYYSPQKFLQILHDFVQNNNVSIKELDEYTIVKTSDLQMMNQKSNNSYTLPQEVYDFFETHAKQVGMNVDDFIQRTFKFLNFDKLIDIEQAEEAATEADNSDINFWELILTPWFEETSLKDHLELLKEENRNLNDHLKSLEVEREKYKEEIVAFNKQLREQQSIMTCPDNTAQKHFLPFPWLVKGVNVLYGRHDADDEVEMTLTNEENSTVIHKIDISENAKITMNVLAELLKDAEQKLGSPNKFPKEQEPHNKISDNDDNSKTAEI